MLREEMRRKILHREDAIIRRRRLGSLHSPRRLLDVPRDYWNIYREGRRTYKLKACPELSLVVGSKLGEGYARYEDDHCYAVALAVKDYDSAESAGDIRQDLQAEEGGVHGDSWQNC